MRCLEMTAAMSEQLASAELNPKLDASCLLARVKVFVPEAMSKVRPPG